MAAALGLGLVCWFVFTVGITAPGRPVNRDTCDCECWDTRFKNGYDARGYKSIYFNIDEKMPGIIAWCVFYFQLAVSSIRTVFDAVVSGEARWSFVLLYLLSLYSHHYSMWCMFNYLNDAFFPMFYTQLFFTTGEIIATMLIVTYSQKSVRLQPLGLWALLCIGMTHVYQNRVDQANPLLGVRLMLYADMVNIAVAAVHMYQLVNTECVCIATLSKNPLAAVQWLIRGADDTPRGKAAKATRSLASISEDGASSIGGATSTGSGLSLSVLIPEAADHADTAEAFGAVDIKGKVTPRRTLGAASAQPLPEDSGAAASSAGSVCPFPPTAKYTWVSVARDFGLTLVACFIATRIVQAL